MKVQKNSLRNILKDKYLNYENSLVLCQLDTLCQRREKLLYTFGKKCIYIEQTKHLFTKKKTDHLMKKRNQERFDVIHANI